MTGTEATILGEGEDPADTELEQLAQQASEIKKGLPEEHLPVVVEFAGSPKSGKSTTIDVVSHFFKRMGFKVRAPSEGASKRTPYHLRRDLVAFNSWTLNYAISELLDAYHNVDRPDLVILDRGPFDSLAWLGLLRSNNDLREENFEAMRAFALVPLWADLVSRIYLFRCDPAVSLERENSAKLTRRDGTAMNPTTLADLRHQYDELGRTLDKYPVKSVDTSNTNSALLTSFRIATDILSCFENE